MTNPIRSTKATPTELRTVCFVFRATASDLLWGCASSYWATIPTRSTPFPFTMSSTATTCPYDRKGSALRKIVLSARV